MFINKKTRWKLVALAEKAEWFAYSEAQMQRRMNTETDPELRRYAAEEHKKYNRRVKYAQKAFRRILKLPY